jgi:hypothetical protein
VIVRALPAPDATKFEQELSLMVICAAKLGAEPLRSAPPERSMANRNLDARLDMELPPNCETENWAKLAEAPDRRHALLSVLPLRYNWILRIGVLLEINQLVAIASSSRFIA